MLLHLIPKIINKYAYVTVSLVDITIPEFNLTLRGGIDIITRKPYPNKAHHVVCRKVGRKAINGIFIETGKKHSNFSVETRWSLDAEQVITHRVNYTVLDSDYDCISDDPLNWTKTREGNFKCRTPERLAKYSPLESKVAMEVLFEGNSSPKKCFYTDTFENGLLIKRVEESHIPTIEYDRLQHWQEMSGRIPSLDDAFRACALQ
ncbi:DUF6012 family protein [Alteromonas gracilis]|uniref:DUF6012 family protein n=1 Tax=Alteromonas gracilis TaxID=1479524 RepID=UPI003734FCC6